ncbi:MAG: hypothetical protein JXB14_02830 [Candidatus Altiarchaeota archaeon]|nr:hypothetical protein [Candidatus Altiarchaeota archaeon]
MTPIRASKGVYTIVTTYVFIIIIVAVVLGLVYFQTSAITQGEVLGSKTTVYSYAKSAKERFFFLYGGDVIQEEFLNKTYDFPGITGIRLVRESYLKCPPFEWVQGDINNFDQKFVYLVPMSVLNQSNNCIAKLEIYI